jgi:putative tricarboxylic transport membrane protein
MKTLAIFLSLFTICVLGEQLHFVIPVAPGGGMDGTARAAGRALRSMGLVENVSFENIVGAGGGRGLSVFVENQRRYRGALLVNSTPLIVRSLRKLFPLGFRELTPIVGLIADYGIFVVREDDTRENWQGILNELETNPRANTFGGGSVRGSLDHIVLALALEAASIDARKVRYVPYDGGGKAMLALLGGEIDILSTGLGETLSFIQSESVRVLAIAAPTRADAAPDVPTLTELGYPVNFANWRGLFAPRGIQKDIRMRHIERFRELTNSLPWRTVLKTHGWQELNLFGEDFSRYLQDQEVLLESTMIKLGFLDQQ